MKSFKQLMEEIREARQLDLFNAEKPAEKSSSAQGNLHGTAYEILVAAHMRKHLSGDSELQDHHFPHSVDEHLNDTEHGKQTSSKETLDSIKEKIGNKYKTLDNHANEDAKAMLSHMESQDPDNYKNLTKSGRFVHVPNISQLSNVVHKEAPKDQKRPSLSSTSDILFTNGKSHIGIDTKYGRSGGISDKTTTHPSLMGILKRGHRLTNTSETSKNEADSLSTIDKTTDENKKARLKIMTRLGKRHSRAFNAMSDTERATAVSRLTNSGADSSVRTFRLHRHSSNKPASISEPSSDFSKENQGARFFSVGSGQGFHIMRKKPGERKWSPYKRVGISSRGSGKNPLISKINVKTPRIRRKTLKDNA